MSTEPGSQLSVLQRVRNKNNLADMLYKRKIHQIKRETTMAMSKIEMEKLDCKSFLKNLRSCDSDDMSEFAPLMSYTLGEELGSAMKGRRTRFRDLFSSEDIDDRLPVALDYRTIKLTGEKHRYKDLKRSRTLIELWTSKLNTAQGAPQLQRAQTDIPLGGDTSQNNPEEGTVNLSGGIITKMVDTSENKGSTFKKLPTPRSSFSNTLPTIKNDATKENSQNRMNIVEAALPAQHNESLPKINDTNQEKLANSMRRDNNAKKPNIRHDNKENLPGKEKKKALLKKIEHFYHEIEPLMPKKEAPEHDWLLPPLSSSDS